MLIKMLRPAILLLLAYAWHGAAHADDMKIDCRLKGGSVVQLTAESCRVEGGVPEIKAASPFSTAVPESAAGSVAMDQLVDPKLAAAQQVIVDLLGKHVVDTTPLKKNPEGIERSARFDGCRLMVDEIMHVISGNFFSVMKDFKISSVIDFRKINRNEFGVLGEINSKGGDLNAAAVYFEQHKDGGNISISVLAPKKGGYEKYTVHGPAGYWSAPKDDLWIADEYGYPKDTGLGTVATDKIRILFIVSSLEDAKGLNAALENMHALCKQ